MQNERRWKIFTLPTTLEELQGVLPCCTCRPWSLRFLLFAGCFGWLLWLVGTSPACRWGGGSVCRTPFDHTLPRILPSGPSCCRRMLFCCRGCELCWAFAAGLKTPASHSLCRSLCLSVASALLCACGCQRLDVPHGSALALLGLC
jgi:hypothetical protein